MSQKWGSRLLLNREVTTSLINANIPLFCRTGLWFSLERQWEKSASHCWVNRVWIIPHWEAHDTVPAPPVLTGNLLPPSHCTGSFERYKVILSRIDMGYLSEKDIC